MPWRCFYRPDLKPKDKRRDSFLPFASLTSSGLAVAFGWLREAVALVDLQAQEIGHRCRETEALGEAKHRRLLGADR
jgi:hypothetical protein